jgi:hypothetical protein
MRGCNRIEEPSWISKDRMFTPEERAQLRVDLLECAARDRRISGAAITGSAATEREDRWSDIDLAFGVADAAELANVLSDWTKRMYHLHSALHHLDVKSGAWIYRVFLLPSSAGRSGLRLRHGIPSPGAVVPPCVRKDERAPAFSAAAAFGHHRPWVALRTSCAKFRCETTTMAGRIHDQWYSRSRVCPGLCSPRPFCYPWPWHRSAAKIRDSAIRGFASPRTRHQRTNTGFSGRSGWLAERNSKRRYGTCGTLATSAHTFNRDRVLKSQARPWLNNGLDLLGRKNARSADVALRTVRR